MEHMVRQRLERHQVLIYFASVAAGAAAAWAITGTEALDGLVNPALALMLFATFLQVPLRDIGAAFRDVRFVAALLAANFIVVPFLVLLLLQLAPDDPLVRLGMLMVLLTPCIDYVITFSQLGRADARSLLAATPLLLAAQMVLLPFYLAAFLGTGASGLVTIGPFLHAFAWLIAVPLALAALVQLWASRSRIGRRAADGLGLLPVPATALVLFLVVAATMPLLGGALGHALAILPLYAGFAVVAPMLGWLTARTFRLGAAASRSIAFSGATRNSLVVLPLALAVPGAVPVLPAVIVMQTLVELLAELVYVRVMPLAGRSLEATEGAA
ncbi:arsenic resistance protein [Vineibacter terrae]|uniref:Arsenic resistance protein n=2 Tax=Vineibacter terrae TaxID=2586908 RepID=A0A5C8PNW7_9HYPH|nr:arsenic resistance protein [Vineibacter terrae]